MTIKKTVISGALTLAAMGTFMVPAASAGGYGYYYPRSYYRNANYSQQENYQGQYMMYRQKYQQMNNNYNDNYYSRCRCRYQGINCPLQYNGQQGSYYYPNMDSSYYYNNTPDTRMVYPMAQQTGYYQPYSYNNGYAPYPTQVTVQQPDTGTTWSYIFP